MESQVDDSSSVTLVATSTSRNAGDSLLTSRHKESNRCRNSLNRHSKKCKGNVCRPSTTFPKSWAATQYWVTKILPGSIAFASEYYKSQSAVGWCGINTHPHFAKWCGVAWEKHPPTLRKVVRCGVGETPIHTSQSDAGWRGRNTHPHFAKRCGVEWEKHISALRKVVRGGVGETPTHTSESGAGWRGRNTQSHFAKWCGVAWEKHPSTLRKVLWVGMGEKRMFPSRSGAGLRIGADLRGAPPIWGAGGCGLESRARHGRQSQLGCKLACKPPPAKLSSIKPGDLIKLLQAGWPSPQGRPTPDLTARGLLRNSPFRPLNDEREVNYAMPVFTYRTWRPPTPSRKPGFTSSERGTNEYKYRRRMCKQRCLAVLGGFRRSTTVYVVNPVARVEVGETIVLVPASYAKKEKVDGVIGIIHEKVDDAIGIIPVKKPVSFSKKSMAALHPLKTDPSHDRPLARPTPHTTDPSHDRLLIVECVELTAKHAVLIAVRSMLIVVHVVLIVVCVADCGSNCGVCNAVCGAIGADCSACCADCSACSANCSVCSAHCSVYSADCSVCSADCGACSADCNMCGAVCSVCRLMRNVVLIMMHTMSIVECVVYAVGSLYRWSYVCSVLEYDCPKCFPMYCYCKWGDHSLHIRGSVIFGVTSLALGAVLIQ
ncbi:hypothetical protein PR048_013334 [Dryococelus australis]|uniref:Uncharacterized protein n=1 Tax=Dryococelus australis TaxID=614101 RepID=A0ABQ9HRU9_9NEOP|nr:hypothetical protein PR048_013334 [Dryococelus australis]